jgi:hypothetical protein
VSAEADRDALLGCLAEEEAGGRSTRLGWKADAAVVVGAEPGTWRDVVDC